MNKVNKAARQDKTRECSEHSVSFSRGTMLSAKLLITSKTEVLEYGIASKKDLSTLPKY